MTDLSRDWVKMIHLDYPNRPTYFSTKALNVPMTPRELMETLASGPIIEDDCIIEGVPDGQLPAYVEGPEDREFLKKLLHETGLTGSGRFFEEPKAVDPYAFLGFERTMATGPNHYVYKRNGVAYGSLGYTFHCYGVKVNTLFISFLMSLDDQSDVDLIWFVTPTDRGMNDSFDVLYDMRFQDYLLKIGKDFQARFVDVSQDVAPAESLLPFVLPEPVATPSTDPVDVLYRQYFGDIRLEAAMSQGLPKEQWRIATYADEVDTAFRRWLVTPKTNLRRFYKYVGLLHQHAPDQAPKLLKEVFYDLKKQLLQHEFYEYIPRLEKGLARIRERCGISFNLE